MTRLLALTTVLLLMLAATAAGAGPQRPNVLVVMTDDQAANGTMAVMPTTRRKIGRQGRTYRQAHVTTPKCCPSRASFFSGRYTHNHGVVDNFSPDQLDQSTTIQRFIRRSGYRTGIFGKYLNSWIDDPPHFDSWSITEGGYSPAIWNIEGRLRTLERYTTDMVSDHALRFLRGSERRDRQPWLAWVTPFAPHLPSTPAARHEGAPLPEFPGTPAMAETDVSDKPDFLSNVRGYQDAIDTARDDGRRSLLAVDEMVGRLLGELRRLGERRRTLVIFTSDNGFLLGEHGGLVGKDLPYLASTHVPLLVRWPGHVRPRSTSRRFVTNVDLAATLLDVARVDRRTDGSSLFARGRHKTLFSENFETRTTQGEFVFPRWRSLRTRDYRYAEYRDEQERLLFSEYYNLRRDPWELDNIAPGLTAERIAVLSGRLGRLARCRGASCP